MGRKKIIEKNNYREKQRTNVNNTILKHLEEKKMSKLLFSTIDIIHKKEYEFMQGSEQLLRVDVCICYDEIIAVRQHCDEEDPIINPNMCVVYLKSGEAFFVFTPYEEVLHNLKSR